MTRLQVPPPPRLRLPHTLPDADPVSRAAPEDPENLLLWRRPDAEGRAALTDPYHPEAFWVDPEDDLPQLNPHLKNLSGLYYTLPPLFLPHRPELWVRGDLPGGWEYTAPDGTTQRLRISPDVMVGEEPAPEEHRTYRSEWDGPVLFAVEILSASTASRDLGPKRQDYARGPRPQELLYYYPATNELWLDRWNGRAYDEVYWGRWAPGAPIRVWSTVLGLGFGVETPGELDVYTPDGQRVDRVEEYPERLQEATQQRQQAEALRRVAEAHAEEEAEQRRLAEEQLRVAEANAQEEAEQRRVAEAHAQAEAKQRHQAEEQRRVAEQQRHAAEAHAQAEAEQRRLAEAHAQEAAEQRRLAEARAVAADARLQELERLVAALQADRSPPAE
ncbi:MAG: hypothetical protein FJX77_02950 [Armatimonadetes bacterium]|nr:hypothetical protein [Armatimonadota bacterium]